MAYCRRLRIGLCLALETEGGLPLKNGDSGLHPAGTLRPWSFYTNPTATTSKCATIRYARVVGGRMYKSPTLLSHENELPIPAGDSVIKRSDEFPAVFAVLV
jgi:hypothetical protein